MDIHSLQYKFSDSDSLSYKEALKFVIKYDSSIKDLDSQLESTQKELDTTNNQIEFHEAVIKSTTKVQIEWINSLSKFQNAQSLYNTAQKEITDSGEITLETFKKLSEANPDIDISKYIETQNGHLKLNIEAWNQDCGAVAATQKVL